jgi:hypothetical protein
MDLIDYFDRGADLYPVRDCLRGRTYDQVRDYSSRQHLVHACAPMLDEKWGEAVKAVVELKPGAIVAADELIHVVRTLREPSWADRERKI